MSGIAQELRLDSHERYGLASLTGQRSDLKRLAHTNARMSNHAVS